MIAARNQIEALASAPRQAIVDHLDTMGRLSVADLASMLGKPPDSLYHHLRRLERVGLVQKVRGAGGEGRACQLYDLITRPADIDYDRVPRSAHASLGRVAAAMVRAASRDFDIALGRTDVKLSGRRRELWAGRRVARLADDEVELVNRVLQRLLLAFRVRSDTRSGKTGRVYGFTFLLAPLRQRRGRPLSSRSRSTAGASRK